MKRIIILLLILSACSDSNNSVDSEKKTVNNNNLFVVNASFELGVDESAVNPKGQKIKFNILTDSRCPTDVECVWEGEVKVKIIVRESDGDQIIFILTNPGDSEEVVIEGKTFVVTLIDVLPYPKSGRQIPRDKYRVILEVKPL